MSSPSRNAYTGVADRVLATAVPATADAVQRAHAPSLPTTTAATYIGTYTYNTAVQRAPAHLRQNLPAAYCRIHPSWLDCEQPSCQLSPPMCKIGVVSNRSSSESVYDVDNNVDLKAYRHYRRASHCTPETQQESFNSLSTTEVTSLSLFYRRDSLQYHSITWIYDIPALHHMEIVLNAIMNNFNLTFFYSLHLSFSSHYMIHNHDCSNRLQLYNGNRYSVKHT